MLDEATAVASNRRVATTLAMCRLDLDAKPPKHGIENYAKCLRVLSQATRLGYEISDLNLERSDADRSVVAVRFDVEGRRPTDELIELLHSLDGVLEVRTDDSAE
jgi:acetolactate synthase regulatory subunit